MKQQAICVLGGTGFVGAQLVSRLVERGHRVRVLTRRRERHRDLLVLPTLQLVEADIHDPRVLAEQFRGQDAVINLVGILNEPGDDGALFRKVHVELARKVVEACRSAGVKRLLHMSALKADAENGPSHYLRSKGEAEDLVHAAADEFDFHVTSFRPAVMFGPGDGLFSRFAGLLRLTPYFFPLACAGTRFAPVYVGDVAEAFARALPDPRTYGQRYDLCGPDVFTLGELVAYAAEAAGLRRRVIALGERGSRLQATLLERVPGKPFSLDNYRSMQVDSVCEGAFPEVFGIRPATVHSIVPRYLGQGGYRARFYDYRKGNGG